MEYKKSYKGIVWWILVFFALPGALALLPIKDEALMTRIFLNVAGLLLTLLMYVIYRTEAVYWINGVEFEQARDAGSERRKRFALRHLERFGWFALLYFLYSIAAQMAGLGFGLDIMLWVVGMIAAALSTIHIKL